MRAVPPDDRSWMPEAARVFAQIEDRLYDAPAAAQARWYAQGAGLAEPALGLAPGGLRLDAMGGDFAFARVKASADDPRRFELATKPEGEPALVWALAPDTADPEPNLIGLAQELVALALTRRRFWRLTLRRVAVAECRAPTSARTPAPWRFTPSSSPCAPPGRISPRARSSRPGPASTP